MPLLNQSSIYRRFKELLPQCKSVKIATAWIFDWPGMDLLAQLAMEKKLAVQVVSGVGGYLTPPIALEKIAAFADLKIFGEPVGQLFHPKIYVFETAIRRIAWVGSCNFTNPGFRSNVEAIFEFPDDGTLSTEFARLWNHVDALPFASFDLGNYVLQRKRVLAQVPKEVADVILSNEDSSSGREDVLKAGWNRYLDELRSTGSGDEAAFKLENWLGVLSSARSFSRQNWTNDVSEEDLSLMYGKGDLAPFGALMPVKQKIFQGSLGSGNRRTVNAALNEAAEMKIFQAPIAQKIFENLVSVEGCGSALATRLLALVRPDIFVVVNRKSFEGLATRLGTYVPRTITAEAYVQLLNKIHAQPWYNSPEPVDPDERVLWCARAALIDPLVYREDGGKYADD